MFPSLFNQVIFHLKSILVAESPSYEIQNSNNKVKMT